MTHSVNIVKILIISGIFEYVQMTTERTHFFEYEKKERKIHFVTYILHNFVLVAAL